MGNIVDKHIGARLEAKRLEKHISIYDIATILQISEADYRYFENGNDRIGSALLYDISQILHISVGYFFAEMYFNQ